VSTPIYFTPDGTGRALYNETVDLSAIGRLHIRRATRIEYDDKAQAWRVYPPRGRKALYSDPSREACLQWEQQYLEAQEDRRHSQMPGKATPGPVTTAP
jgi:hypothetical protein